MRIFGWLVCSALVAGSGCGGREPLTEPEEDAGTDASTDAGPTLGGACGAAGQLGCQGVGQKLQLLCDGSKWVSNGVCAGDLVCDPRPGPTVGSCQPPACKAGVTTCEGPALVKCAADLLTKEKTECASDEHCKQAVGGLCAQCLAWEARCDGATLMKCSPDRQKLVFKDTCASEGLCDAKAITCKPPACVADEYRCSGDVLEQCKPDRTSFVSVATCGAGLCDAAGKKCNAACAAGDYRCSGDVLETCNSALTGFDPVKTCAATLCDSAGKECDDCKSGWADCVGSVPRACDSFGHWKSLTACTGTTPVCKAGTCAAGVCSSGEYRCTGDTLETCNAGLTGFQTVKTCGSGLCDAVGKECDECKSGEKSCVGSTPRSCDVTGHWVSLTACSGTTPTCSAGTCVWSGVAFPSSALVDTTQGAKINSWVGTPTQTWKRCYSKFLDGAGSATFHTKCDGLGPSVTIAKLSSSGGSRMIGGYTSVSWSSISGSRTDATAFLFSITNDFKHAPLSSSGSSSDISYASTFGPWFGGGADWRVNGDINSGYCNIGYTYACRVDVLGSATCRNDFCGTYDTWSIANLEVWVK